MSRLHELNDEQFDERVLLADGPVLVQFWAPWCGPCRRVIPVVNNVLDEYKDRIQFVKINTDDNDRTPETYDISSIPSFLLFQQGREVARWVGQKGAHRMYVEIGDKIGS